MSPIDQAHSIEELRRRARRRLPRGVFDFFDGGADDETTLLANRQAFDSIRLRPHVLRNVQQPDLSTQILGLPAAAPIVIAPTGATGIGWPDADIAIARAAARLGIPYALSTAATASIENVATLAGGRLWFQLYILRDFAFTLGLLERAASADYEALVVTLDMATGGKRERDIRNGFTVPLVPRLRTALDFAAHPAWCLQMLRHGQPSFENLRGFGGASHGGMSIAARAGQNLDASFDWDALQRIRDKWPRKLLVKGVSRAEDAVRLAAMGLDGIWVSNHGGRQLDGSIASADALPEVVGAVSGRIPVLVDSGVRRGADIVKAIALGAQAVAIGRATLYGVAAAGEAGAQRAVTILTDELRRAMQLCGTPTIPEINSGLLQLKPAYRPS
jgi:(S)-mandelate dehydrogenase